MDYESAFPARIRALPVFVSGTKALAGARETARVLNASGCEVLFTLNSAGRVLPPHSHKGERIALVISGQTLVTTDDGEQRCGPGQWYHMDPGQKHSIRFDADTAQIEMEFDAQA